MYFWQYSADKYFPRLLERLEKYRGGQILLRTRDGEEFRGPFSTYKPSGFCVAFEMIWLARKQIITRSFWSPSWRWDITHPIVRRIGCQLNIELAEGKEDGGPSTNVKETGGQVGVNLKKFHQDKPIWGRNKKCLIFTTTLGEEGTLFQPGDPRNLQLEIYPDGEFVVVDPSLPPPKTVTVPKSEK